MAMHTVITVGRLEALERAERENAALREKVKELVKEKLHLKAMVFVFAEQAGEGNIGKIQAEIEWAETEAEKREGIQ